MNLELARTYNDPSNRISIKEQYLRSDQPRTSEHTRQLLVKLKLLDEEFRELHYEIIDLINEGGEDVIEAEQVILDKHDDDVATLTVRLESLSTAAVASTPDTRKPLSRRLSRIQTGLRRIRDLVEDSSSERSVLMQCQEESADLKKDLTALYDMLLSNDIDERDEMSIAHSALEVELSEIVKGSLVATPSEVSAPRAASGGSGVKLPKLDVPTFDGSIVHWKQFWDQFTVSVHDRTNL